MSLKEFTNQLTENGRLDLAIAFVKLGLPIWEEYSRNERRLEYIDTVVGMDHQVDKEIIKRVVNLAHKWKIKEPVKSEIEQINSEFGDPIVALRDLDWEIPEEIQLIFYAASNLVRKMNGHEYSMFGEEQLYLVINQMADGLIKSGNYNLNQLNELLTTYKNT